MGKAQAVVKERFEYSKNPVLQRRLELLCQELTGFCRKRLAKLTDEANKEVIADFIHYLTHKENRSKATKEAYTVNLLYLIEDTKGKSVRNMEAMDLDLYLQSVQKSRAIDPKQKWISTYNQRAITYIKFFRWLYYPDLPPRKRPKPDVIKNVVTFEKPEATNVEAKDLWTPEMDRVFLKYCLDARLCWYHVAADDTSGRPSEILAKRFADVKVKMNGGKVFGEMEIGRGGKTVSRTVPLVRSLPYFKQLAATTTDPQSFIFRSERNADKYRNVPISEKALAQMYRKLKHEYFPALLKRPDVPPEDKAIIEEMLTKPWNPYIRRHTALTEKAKYLNEYNMRLHAGWTKNSDMPKIYTHELGGESSRAILSQLGFIESDVKARRDMLEPKYCPECKEPNKPDSLFCTKAGCGHPLSYAAYKDVVEKEQAQHDEIAWMKKEILDMKRQRAAAESTDTTVNNP